MDGTDSILVALLPAVGLALIVMGLMMTLRARRRRESTRLTAREELERMRQRDGVRGDLEQLMVEIEQLAKRMSAQLDAKSVELESLLRRADAAVSELRRLSESPRPGAGKPAEPAAESRPAAEADPLARRVCALAAEGLTPVDIARRLDEHVGKVELILALHRA